jgi:hypothetical protein
VQGPSEDAEKLAAQLLEQIQSPASAQGLRLGRRA